MKFVRDILVVDEQTPNLELLTDLLEKEGYEVRAADNPQMAIDSAILNPPGLILLDLGMPGMDGFELCQHLKRDKRTKHVPVIFISSFKDVEERVRCFEAGGADFISKPIQEVEVLSRVRTHMQLREMQQNIRALKESEMHFRSFVENANETIVVSQDELVKYANEQIRELTGYSPEETLSLRFNDFIHPGDLKRVLSEYRSRISRKKSTGNYSVRIITKHGKEKHLYVNSTSIIWEGKPATLAMLTDITELKRTEAELSKSEEHFRRLMEQSPQPIEILNTEGKITQVNPAWSKLWGISEAEAEETIALYNMLTDPQLVKLGVMPLVERAFKGETIILPPISYSVNTSAEDIGLPNIKGKNVWIQSHLSAIKDEDGEIELVMNTYLDLTDQKKAEDEVLIQREILARAGRANRFGQLTGSIAHELNQPLSGILSNAQATELLLKQGKLDDDELKEIMADIVRDTKRAGQVIRNLRQMYKEQKVEFKPVNINALIKETAGLLNSEIVSNHIELSFALSNSLPSVNCNWIQIQQVVVNLIMNSSQSMKKTEKKKRSLLVASEFEGSNILVRVEDSGTGIKASIIDKMFDPFTSWKTDGTGMGLAISKSIIESHEGKIWAENLPEGGARVGFTIPVLKENGQI